MKTLVIRIIRNSLVGQQSADLRKPGCKLKATAASSCNAKSEKQKASPSDFIRDRMLSKRASVLLSGPCQEQFIRFGMSSSMPKIQCHAQLWAYACLRSDEIFPGTRSNTPSAGHGIGKKVGAEGPRGERSRDSWMEQHRKAEKADLLHNTWESDLHIAKEATNG